MFQRGPVQTKRKLSFSFAHIDMNKINKTLSLKNDLTSKLAKSGVETQNKKIKSKNKFRLQSLAKQKIKIALFQDSFLAPPGLCILPKSKSSDNPAPSPISISSSSFSSIGFRR